MVQRNEKTMAAYLLETYMEEEKEGKINNE